MNDIKLNIFFIVLGSAFILYDRFHYRKKSKEEKENPMNKMRLFNGYFIGGIFFVAGILKLLFTLLTYME